MEFFKKRPKSELAQQFEQLARFVQANDIEGARGLLEQVLRLHGDDAEVKKNRNKLYHFLVDYFIHGTKGLDENIKELLNASHLNVPYNDQEFMLIALSRQAEIDLDAALANAYHWYEQVSNDKFRQRLLRRFLIRKHDFPRVAEMSRIYFETSEDEFTKDERGYYQVFDAAGEQEYVRGEKCDCGEYFQWNGHNNRSEEGLTENIGKCPKCATEKSFLLSISNKTFQENLGKFMKEFGL
ncbi:hypothetical protein HY622_03440 [Candidatus Uhrbacteria bacterium]|nr:hypothetical protein [Candidatus Uhrbacteria bacterium]